MSSITRDEFKQLVEKATQESGEEDWAVIMDICDKAGHSPKDCLSVTMRRLKDSSSSVQSKTLTLLDALVQNGGPNVLAQVATKDFTSHILTYVANKASYSEKVKFLKMLKSWCEKEFKGNPSYSVIPNLCQRLKDDGYFISANIQISDAIIGASSSSSPSAATKDSAAADSDLAKAIELSLKEAKKTVSLYPSMPFSDNSADNSSHYSHNNSGPIYATISKEPKKVRALYDFQAAEDNELTFTTGETIDIIDDSDMNWWKGRTWRGEGLFPSNFVTSDLTAEPEEDTRAVQFNEVVEVKQLDPDTVEIEEGKIDEALNLIQNADPTGENEADSAEMLTLEEECKIMGSLIDQELEKVDSSHSELMALHSKLVEAVNLYMELMAQVPAPAKALPAQPAYLPQQTPYNMATAQGFNPQMATGQMGTSQSYAMGQAIAQMSAQQQIPQQPPQQQQGVVPSIHSQQMMSNQQPLPGQQAPPMMQSQHASMGQPMGGQQPLPSNVPFQLQQQFQSNLGTNLSNIQYIDSQSMYTGALPQGTPAPPPSADQMGGAYQQVGMARPQQSMM